jgi:hypothetical protein
MRRGRKTGGFTGQWRIAEMERWGQDAIDLDGPAFITFGGDGTGEFGFIVVRGWMDCRFGERNGSPLVEFSWQGADEGDEVCGRGWATLEGDDTMTGRIFFHQGDDSGFSALRDQRPSRRGHRTRPGSPHE